MENTYILLNDFDIFFFNLLQNNNYLPLGKDKLQINIIWVT